MAGSNNRLERSLDQFVLDLHVRTKATDYRCVVRRFHRFLGHKGIFSPFDQSCLRRWLRAQLPGSPLWLVVHRAQLVTRFLDWLVEHEVIPVNPLAELREKYQCRSTASIVRALITSKPSTALEALRPPPQYGSHLGPTMRDHIQRMRSLGYQYGHESEFLRFDRFLQQRPGAAAEPLSKLVREYAAMAGSPAVKLRRLRIGNLIGKALTRNGAPTPPIIADRLLIHDVVRHRCHPFIYSHEQIELLLKTARAYPGRRAPLRPLTLYTMLAVAYCAGLRLAEIVGLELRDIDLEAGTIDVRNTKFFKSRRLPLSPSAIAALRNYLTVRRKIGASLEPQASLFVHEKGGYSSITAGALLKNVIRRAGLNTGRGRGGPRIHDIRHTFVVHRMTAWYREGVDAQSRLQHLSTYLGHRDIHSTLIYLTITQELLQHANGRFRTAEATVLQAIREGSQE